MYFLFEVFSLLFATRINLTSEFTNEFKYPLTIPIYLFQTIHWEFDWFFQRYEKPDFLFTRPVVVST